MRAAQRYRRPPTAPLAINRGVRKGFVITLALLCALLAVPGTALASGGLAITTGADSGVVPSGAGNCTYNGEVHASRQRQPRLRPYDSIKRLT
jgi:hypothetical protein